MVRSIRTAAAAVLVTLASGCAGKKASSPQQPARPEASPPRESAKVEPVVVERPVAWTEIDLRLAAPGALIDAAEALSVWYRPPESPKPDYRAEIEALLLQLGGGPSLFASIDLAGAHQGVFAYPHPEDRDAAAVPLRAAIAVASTDPEGFIRGLPSMTAPRKVASGLWEGTVDRTRVLFRERAGAVEIGLSEADLERARALPAPAATPFRVVLELRNPPRAEVDPSPLLGLSPGDPLAKALADVFAELRRVQAALDLGPDRDLQLQFAAEAPFARLGPEVLGAPATVPSSIEKALPRGPVLAIHVAVADAGPAVAGVRKILRADEVPPPFDDLLRRGLEHFEAVARLVDGAAFAALVPDGRDGANFLLAAKIRNGSRGRTDAAGLLEVLADAAKAQNDLVGEDRKARVEARLVRGAWKLTNARADVLHLAPPRDAGVETTALAPFFRKGRADVALWQQGEHLILVVGGTARTLAREVSRNLARNAGGGPVVGLGLARRDGGCQVCVAVDGDQVLRLLADGRAADTADRNLARRLRAAREGLRKAGGGLPLGIGARVSADRGAVVFRVPRSALFPDPTYVRAVREALDALNAPEPPADAGAKDG